MPPVLTKNGDQLELALSGCRGMEFQDAKEKIKEIPGRRWDPETKNWVVPADPQIADRILKTIRPEANQELLNWIIASKVTHEESLLTPIPPDPGDLLLPWAYARAHWQPEFINEVRVAGLNADQRAAVRLMAERKRYVLADDMGLGKTVQCIASVEEYSLRNGQVDGPKLIVAPASVMGGWARELNRWLDDPDVVLVSGNSSPRKATLEDNLALGHEPNGEGAYPSRLTGAEARTRLIQEAIERNAWIIVNWEQLRIEKVKEKKELRNGGTKTITKTVMKQPLFESTEWLAVVADEVHRAKNREASQTQGLWRVTGQLMIGATGTAIMNSPDEAWAVLRWMWPEEFHELGAKRNATAYWSFYNDYVEYYEDHFKRKVVTGVKNPDALRFVLKDKLIRRLAKGGGRRRIYDPVALNPKQQQLYDEAETAMWLAVEKDIAAGNKQALEFAQKASTGVSTATLWQLPNGAARMVRLRQIIENSALLGGDDDSANMDYFEQKFEDSRPEPWVFFCAFKESCDIFAERLRSKYGAKVGVYHGEVPPKKRTEMEDAFQAGDLDAMVGTIGAMKEGITLTRSHLMGFISRDWVPDVNEQCEAREDRIGQQRKVMVYIPQATATVATDNIEPTNRLKEEIVRSVLPKQKIEEVTNT